MRHYILLFMCWLLTLGCGAQKPQDVEPNEPVEPFNYEREYTKEDSALVVKLLKDAKKNRKTLESRMLYFGKKFLGLPYVGHTLELGDKEHLIVNLRELDCTTFVETVTALTLCDIQDKRTFDDFCNNLMRIRYRQGKMEDYTSRLHYFTWWGDDNVAMGIVKEISMQGKPFAATQTININYMSKHPDLYKQLKNHPEFVPVIKAYEDETNGRQYRYVPKENLNWHQSTPLGVIHDGDIVAMLTDKDGLDTRHIAIAFWKDGRLHLMHASSLYKKVVMSQETFYEYEMRQSKHTGIRVWRVVE